MRSFSEAGAIGEWPLLAHHHRDPVGRPQQLPQPPWLLWNGPLEQTAATATQGAFTQEVSTPPGMSQHEEDLD